MESITSKPSRSRRSIRQIHDLLRVFDEGNINATEFCKLHNISKGTFYKWQSRYKRNKEKKMNKPGFAEVKIISSSPGSVLFAEVRGIRIYQQVSAAFLKELLR